MNVNYPIKKIDEVLNSLRYSKYFCKLDLFKAYLHLQTDEKGIIIQTISISAHRGTYKMNRLSFGIKTAPAEFNRVIDQILNGLPKTIAYFDDIVVHGKTKDQCSKNPFACLESEDYNPDYDQFINPPITQRNRLTTDLDLGDYDQQQRSSPLIRRSARLRRPPAYLDDYDLS
ncbi:hypothetical protein AVEN_216678-1 [Araneus ventricosus]|uniref:Reverse transcriptase domain-containing protein n=1 Tax=Araneus ventricosus TaxID=182803 RepID=A0A4Y2DX90_ARAVE|nr:hypothetical protein AVEN_216678-1 [Araneus ventricosus]